MQGRKRTTGAEIKIYCNIIHTHVGTISNAYCIIYVDADFHGCMTEPGGASCFVLFCSSCCCRTDVEEAEGVGGGI